jgi:hypothetical protein
LRATGMHLWRVVVLSEVMTRAGCTRAAQVLGVEATEEYLTYVECDKKGANSKRDFCKEKKVPGFPTWEINGELFPGEKSLEDLAKISGFKK